MRKSILFLTILASFFILSSQVSSVSAAYLRGVNLFGGWQGQYGGVDTFPGLPLLTYLKGKGLTTFRVGFSWLHLQPSLNGPLDPTYLAKMDTLVSDAKSLGEQVAFVPLPGQYNGNDVNTSAVPQSAYNDMWIKLATHYKNESAIWGYDLINEPNMGDSWNTTIAPSVIQAIRTVDMTHPIIVPTSTGGYGHFFTSHLAGLPMTDPANNLIYEAHFYFDNPPNGQYVNGYDAGTDLMIGVEHAQGFVNWCNTNHQNCYVGEYGVPGGWTHGDTTCIYDSGTNNDPRWETIMDNFLTYLDQNNISATYWETGPYGDINSMGPFCDANGNWFDGPQVAVLEKHLGSNVPTPQPTATPLPTPTVKPTATPTATPTQAPTPTPAGQINIDDSVIGSGLNQVNYSGGGWSHCTNCNETNPTVTFFNASQSWDQTTGDFLTLQFSGTQIQFYGVTAAWHGIGAVSIDGGSESNIDFYSLNKTGDVLLWTSPVLSAGTHTFKLRVTGNKNSNSTGTFIVVDDFIVSNGGGTPNPTPTAAPIPGDANGDGKVDNTDYSIWLTNYGQSKNGGNLVGDFNSDTVIDGIDYVIWLTHYNGTIVQPTPTPISVVTPTPVATNTPAATATPVAGSVLLGSNMTMTTGTGQIVGGDLQISTNGTATGIIQGPIHTLTVSARADLCAGAPHINMLVNGNYVLDQNVSATTNTNYTTNDLSFMNLGNQSYTVQIVYNNAFSDSTCNRNVYIHSITAL